MFSQIINVQTKGKIVHNISVIMWNCKFDQSLNQSSSNINTLAKSIAQNNIPRTSQVSRSGLVKLTLRLLLTNQLLRLLKRVSPMVAPVGCTLGHAIPSFSLFCFLHTFHFSYIKLFNYFTL